MIARNIVLELDEVEAGMILANAIYDAHGGVLLPAGVEFSDSILTSLRRRGIDQVEVVDDHISEADLAAENERMRGRLDKLFRNCINQGASGALMESIVQYRFGEPS